MLTKFFSSLSLILLVGCTHTGSAPELTDEQNTVTAPEIKPTKPTVRQLMPGVKMKVASPKLIKPTQRAKLQYKALLARPTKSAI